ncbi:LysR substrate-binding domain-containing protein [Mesorhizobium sp.]|uniref:LysR substrate-binding domain-containing protein n=1 Tax=Mesorhizobium sp. TaxID=1871066 RepID=UPI0025C0A2A5|nr:LysR substrate-binding domain-containing protein [Mesorhizobium sp.]
MRSKTLYRNIQRLLPTFEAAARHGNFTLAGEEIGLSQSAVSKQIMELEGRLGQALFARAHKHISLTSAGRRLQRAYTSAASQIIDALEEFIQEQSTQQIVLSTSTARAAFMLLPHVVELRECFGGAEIFVLTSDPNGIDPTRHVDLAITFGNPELAGFNVRPLFSDIVTPVCSPEFLEKNGPLESVSDLLNCELLYMQQQDPTWGGWPQWLRAFSSQTPQHHQAMGFNNYYNTIQACMAGQGVALGWLRLLGDMLESGRLVIPLPQCLVTEDKYHLAWPYHRPPHSDIECFEEWLNRRFGGPIPRFNQLASTR